MSDGAAPVQTSRATSFYRVLVGDRKQPAYALEYVRPSSDAGAGYVVECVLFSAEQALLLLGLITAGLAAAEPGTRWIG